MFFHFINNKKNISKALLAKKMLSKVFCARYLAVLIIFTAMGAVADNAIFSDEEEKRRVDISLTIFPRIVAVDNNFRSKLSSDRKVNLVFIYSDSKDVARSLAESLKRKNKNIGGMGVDVRAMSVGELVSESNKHDITALFLSERLAENTFKDVLAFAEKKNRIVFSPFTGDVERGATVGISVTNRVKPYFNLSTLKKSNIVINALLMKMSKRYE
jgi:hypothetical protein